MHAKIENGQVAKYPIVNLMQELPNVSLPANLSNDEALPEGYVYVNAAPPPEYNNLSQRQQEGTPEIGVDGKWYQTWTVVDLPEADAQQNLQQARAMRWEDIKRIRDQKTQQGGYQVGNNWFHSDTFSRTQQIGLTIMGANMPAGIMWKTMGGEFVEMSPTLAQQIFTAAGAQDTALFTHAEQLKVQMEAAENPLTFNINTGWPATYNNV